jgi:RNA-directed DNA polymerase
LAVVAERISDGAILALIKQWLKAAVVEEEDDGKRHTGGGGKGNGCGSFGTSQPTLSGRLLEREALIA